MIIICTCGQIAIKVKKRTEYKRDLAQVRHVQAQLSDCLKPDDPQGTKSTKTNNKLIKINNQKWNEHFCSNSGIILLLIIVFLIGSCATILQWVVFNGSDLTEELKTQFKYHILQLISTVLIPIFIYLKHGKLYKHVKTEIIG